MRNGRQITLDAAKESEPSTDVQDILADIMLSCAFTAKDLRHKRVLELEDINKLDRVMDVLTKAEKITRDRLKQAIEDADNKPLEDVQAFLDDDA